MLEERTRLFKGTGALHWGPSSLGLASILGTSERG